MLAGAAWFGNLALQAGFPRPRPRHRDGLCPPVLTHAFAIRFAASEGPRATLAYVAQSVGRNDLCPCGSGKKYKRCCLDLDRQGGSGHLVEYDDGSGELMLFVETSSGVMVRRIPSAAALRPDRVQGLAAEEAINDAAAVWSIPDFVYQSKVRKVGSGSRELGDRFLIVGDLGVVVQVKSRDGLTPDPVKERLWIEKQVRRALRQANGAIRSLQRQPEHLTNARGRELKVDARELRWVVAVVIDHPEVPDGINLGAFKSPTAFVVLTRRDWEFLFNQLKSLHAVGEYLERVSSDPIELGDEPIRYYQLASADEQTPPAQDGSQPEDHRCSPSVVAEATNGAGGAWRR